MSQTSSNESTPAPGRIGRVLNRGALALALMGLMNAAIVYWFLERTEAHGTTILLVSRQKTLALELLVYEPKPGHELDDDALTDPLEFLARVLIHIPEPNKHLVHFYGAYANRIRQNFREQFRPDDDAKPSPSRRAANKRWAELIYRIYEVEPLTCTQCGGEMKILAFITDPQAIRAILDHRAQTSAEPRAPPQPSSN